MTEPLSTLSDEDYRSLVRAFERLEHPSFAVKLTNVVGTPIEMALPASDMMFAVSRMK